MNTRIDTPHEKWWFWSEAEARATGWRLMRRHAGASEALHLMNVCEGVFWALQRKAAR